MFDFAEGESELVHNAVLSYFLCLGVLFVYRVMHFHRLEFSVDSYIWIFTNTPEGAGEPAVWLPAAQVQEQQRLAEALGRLYQLLPLLLQELPGTFTVEKHLCIL